MSGVIGHAAGERSMVRSPRMRRRCPCGCGGTSTHSGRGTGGIALMWGCELYVRRWVRDGYTAELLGWAVGDDGTLRRRSGQIFPTHGSADANRGGPLDDRPERSAVLSSCGRYRYLLTRRWSTDGPAAVFIMLNPSTADAVADDPTIRRCIGFARENRCGAIIVVNLYALRATDPRQLQTAEDPVGPLNDRYLMQAVRAGHTAGAPVIAAWGASDPGSRGQSVLEVASRSGPIHCLGTTNAGAPRHPLYLRRNTHLQPILTIARPATDEPIGAAAHGMSDRVATITETPLSRRRKEIAP